MPSRKTAHRCPFCGHKNVHQSRYCNECGKQLKQRAPQPGDQARLHVDIAHPITPECRRMIQDVVLHAFEEERRHGRSRTHEERKTETDYEFA
jgi:hypothetical protein